MATKGNIGWQLRDMQEAKSVTSTVQCIFRGPEGILLGYSNITTAGALELITDGTLSPGALVCCAVGSAVASVHWMLNTGTSTAPVFVAMISAGIDPDA